MPRRSAVWATPWLEAQRCLASCSWRTPAPHPSSSRSSPWDPRRASTPPPPRSSTSPSPGGSSSCWHRASSTRSPPPAPTPHTTPPPPCTASFASSWIVARTAVACGEPRWSATSMDLPAATGGPFPSLLAAVPRCSCGLRRTPLVPSGGADPDLRPADPVRRGAARCPGSSGRHGAWGAMADSNPSGEELGSKMESQMRLHAAGGGGRRRRRRPPAPGPLRSCSGDEMAAASLSLLLRRGNPKGCASSGRAALRRCGPPAPARRRGIVDSSPSQPPTASLGARRGAAGWRGSFDPGGTALGERGVVAGRTSTTARADAAPRIPVGLCIHHGASAYWFVPASSSHAVNLFNEIPVNIVTCIAARDERRHGVQI